MARDANFSARILKRETCITCKNNNILNVMFVAVRYSVMKMTLQINVITAKISKNRLKKCDFRYFHLPMNPWNLLMHDDDQNLNNNSMNKIGDKIMQNIFVINLAVDSYLKIDSSNMLKKTNGIIMNKTNMK